MHYHERDLDPLSHGDIMSRDEVEIKNVARVRNRAVPAMLARPGRSARKLRASCVRQSGLVSVVRRNRNVTALPGKACSGVWTFSAHANGVSNPGCSPGYHVTDLPPFHKAESLGCESLGWSAAKAQEGKPTKSFWRPYRRMALT